MTEGMKWIKLSTNIFDQGKIRLIEKMPAGDTILVIWLKILTLCGKECQDGTLRISNEIPYTVDTLAAIFDRDLSTIKLAMDTFERFHMIEYVDGAYTLPKWREYQAIGKYEHIKELARKRKQKQRETLKKAKTPLLEGTTPECHVTVTSQSRDVTPVDKIRLDKIRVEEERKEEKAKPPASRLHQDNNVVDFYQKNFWPLSSEYEKECLCDLINDYGESWTLEALKEAIRYNKKSLRYAEKILQRWKREGFKTESSSYRHNGPSTQSQETIDQAKEIPF